MIAKGWDAGAVPTCSDLALRSGEESWRSLRQRRAQAPAAATSRDRAATFRAALEQAEQQVRAAATIGYDSRALNLFYGLSQGGRALAAAAPDLVDKEWELRGHGLTFPGGDAASDVTAVRVQPMPEAAKSSFVRLSGVLGSPITGEVTLGELWPLMYETTMGAPLGDVRHAPMVTTTSVQRRDGDGEQLVIEAARLSVPAAMRATAEHQRPDVGAFLARYPAVHGSVMGWISPTPPGGLPAYWMESGEFMLEWQEPRDQRAQPAHVLDGRLTRYRGESLVLPTIAGADQVLHPLMVWWQVLYALSMLTRYEPARWTKMIDIDSCAQAVAIEYILDTALAAVPDLLDEALGSLVTP